MEQYQQKIAKNPKVEFIHVSQDSSEDSAEEWAAKEAFPWLTVVPGDVDRSKLLEFKLGNSVPHYIMVDSAGERVANGSSAVFRKIDEISAEAE